MTVATAPAPTTRPTSRRWTLLRVLTWILVVGCAAWATLRGFGLERGALLIQGIAFTPYVAAGTVVVALVALVRRYWLASVVALVAAGTLGYAVVPRALADDTPTDDGPHLRVMSSNMLEGGADPAAIVALIRDRRVDLLTLQEFTPAAERALDHAGIAALLPYRVAYPTPAVWGSGVYSRYPLRDDGLRRFSSEFTQARATVTVPGARPVAVESAHPCAPASVELAPLWKADMADEPAATPDGTPRILAGDLNSTLDHAGLRELIATGYRDAGDVTGRGLYGTWPYAGPTLPKVTLDHVLADRRIGIAAYTVLPVPRSDHRAVFADLVLPRR
jgi:endonuclease/exonuclease/phosphatase (EEP) superfamily protein YafD